MKPWEELRYVIQHYLLGKYDTDTFSDVYYDIYVHKMYGYKLKNTDKDVLDNFSMYRVGIPLIERIERPAYIFQSKKLRSRRQ